MTYSVNLGKNMVLIFSEASFSPREALSNFEEGSLPREIVAFLFKLLLQIAVGGEF